VQASVFAALLGLASMAEAPVDEFVPFTDGRFGGCYKDGNGRLYSCTRPPRKIDETSVQPEDASTAGDDSLSEEGAREELRRVRLELEELKRRMALEDARRESERLERESVARAASAGEQRDIDAAMAAYNAIEAAKDSQNLKRLQQKTEACRARLEAKGYTLLGPGACKSPTGVYENCPDC
jgi:CO/xanthine dehydrogenase Mo-binding subunit